MPGPDLKPPKAIRDADLLAALHLEWSGCVTCMVSRGQLRELEPSWAMSLHHVSKHPKDDLRPNLVMVCGSGTTGCHGDLENHEPLVKACLGYYIRLYRQDTQAYLDERFPHEGADAWIRRTLGA